MNKIVRINQLNCLQQYGTAEAFYNMLMKATLRLTPSKVVSTEELSQQI